MPGFIIHVGASAQCLHGGKAIPLGFDPNILVDGKPALTITGSSAYSIAGCPHPPSGTPVPCIGDIGIMGSSSVLANKKPLALLNAMPKTIPNGADLIISGNQTRVTAK